MAEVKLGSYSFLLSFMGAVHSGLFFLYIFTLGLAFFTVKEKYGRTGGQTVTTSLCDARVNSGKGATHCTRPGSECSKLSRLRLARQNSNLHRFLV